MAEEQTQSTTPESSEAQQQTQQTQTLDDVYKQFNVDEAASSFQPRREPQQPQVQPAQGGIQSQPSQPMPDPVTDLDGYQRWLASQNASVQNSLYAVTTELQALRAERVKSKEETDIKNAVSRFRQTAGEDVDEDMAEVALGLRAKKDPKFLSVYVNRDKNPNAWNAAIVAFANEFKSKHQFKVDPAIAEAQRAAKASIGSQATEKDGEPTGDDKRFANKSGREFDAEWQRYIHQGYL